MWALTEIEPTIIEMRRSAASLSLVEVGFDDGWMALIADRMSSERDSRRANSLSFHIAAV